jgi:hypothetical protein
MRGERVEEERCWEDKALVAGPTSLGSRIGDTLAVTKAVRPATWSMYH